MTSPTPITDVNSIDSISDIMTLEAGGLTDTGVLTGTELLAASRGTGLLQTTPAELATYTLSPISAGTLTNAGTLTGAETVPVGRSGLFQTTLNAMGTFINNLVNPTTLPTAATFTGTELNAVNQNGNLVKSTLSTLAGFVLSTFAGFTQAATGAIARSVVNELQDRISAKQFGARGNAIQLFTGAVIVGSTAFTATGASFASTDVGKGIAIAGAGAGGATLTTTISAYLSATSVTLATAASTTVSGATATYGTDDTAALNAFITYLVTNHRTGLIPGATYYISGPLNLPNSQNWGILGESYGCTQIIQATDNTPIFVFGSSGTSAAFDVRIHDLQFSYAGVQPIANTLANPISFQTGWFHVSLQRLVFNGGYYGIFLVSGVACPWGCNWDDLQFGGNISGGAINWTGGVNAVPNNVWGRIVVTGTSMAGPIFNNIKGYNFTIQAIEMLNTALGAQLMTLQAGSIVKIGSMKLENGTYNAANSLFTFPTGCEVSLGSFTLINSAAMYLTPASGALNIFNFGGGGGGGSLDIEYLGLAATTMSGNVYVFAGGGPATPGALISYGQGNIRVKHITIDTNPWLLTNFGSSVTADYLSVDDWKNDKLGANLGNASYAATLGDPSITCFETAFTSPQTYALDSNSGQLFNGMYREIRCMGAINGSNNLTITCGGTTLLTLNTDGVVVRFTFGRRDASHVYNCWKVTKYNTGLTI
jgi:hypothetical protein